MVSKFARACNFVVFFAAIMSWNPSASAASIITFRHSNTINYYDPPYYDFQIIFEEKQISYDPITGVQSAPVISGFIPTSHNFVDGSANGFFDAHGLISLQETDGAWALSLDIFWERGSELDAYWVQVGAGLFPNEQSIPNLLVEGSWRAEEGSDLQLLHAEENYDYRPGAYYSVIDASISRISPIPEPRAWGLLLLGFGAVGAAIRRRRAKLPIKEPQAAPLSRA